jgi:hypothetical protein
MKDKLFVLLVLQIECSRLWLRYIFISGFKFFVFYHCFALLAFLGFLVNARLNGVLLF